MEKLHSILIRKIGEKFEVIATWEVDYGDGPEFEEDRYTSQYKRDIISYVESAMWGRGDANL